MRIIRILIAQGLVLFVSAVPVKGQPPVYQTLAVTGDAVPGQSGITFNRFSGGFINSSGKVSFQALLAGEGVTSDNDAAIFSDADGSLALVAREGAPAPGTDSGTTFRSFGSWIISDTGRIGLQASLNPLQSGIWSGPPASLQPVALSGTQAPGLPAGVNFGNINSYSYSFGPVGQNAFRNRLTGTGVTTANAESIWWSADAGVPLMVARAGQQAPGLPAGVTFRSFYDPATSAPGQVAFYANFGGPGFEFDEDGIWMGPPDAVQPVMTAGDPVSGLPGVTYSYADPFFKTNQAGQMAMLSSIEGPGVDNSNWDVIVGGHPAALEIIARSGSQAPGMAGGAAFHYFGLPSLAPSGDIAFVASLRNSAIYSGLWHDRDGMLSLLAHAGQHAPGTPDGVNFTDFYFSYMQPTMNANGQVAFRINLTGTDVTSANNTGIWATDPEGLLHLIARSGDLFEVAPGDFRTIFSLGWPVEGGGEHGWGSSFNGRGELIFTASFTDGTSGVFIATIPEPASWLLVLAAGTLIICRRARQVRAPALVPHSRADVHRHNDGTCT